MKSLSFRSTLRAEESLHSCIPKKKERFLASLGMTTVVFFTNASGGLVVNLYRGSAGFIHLLGGVGIEVGNRDRVSNPFRGDVLQLRADDREYRREQNAPISPNKNEIAHIRDRHGRLRFSHWCRKVSRIPL